MAYHYTQACVGAETSEYESAGKAVTLWAQSADEAQDAELYGEALRMLQRAVAIADILMAYLTEHKIKKRRLSSVPVTQRREE